MVWTCLLIKLCDNFPNRTTILIIIGIINNCINGMYNSYVVLNGSILICPSPQLRSLPWRNDRDLFHGLWRLLANTSQQSFDPGSHQPVQPKEHFWNLPATSQICNLTMGLCLPWIILPISWRESEHLNGSWSMQHASQICAIGPARTPSKPDSLPSVEVHEKALAKGSWDDENRIILLQTIL